MRFLKFAKPLVAVAALAFAASNIGCAVPTSGEENAPIGTQRQAVELSAITGGAQAAIQLLGMLNTYKKYGEPVVSQGEILAKVNEVQADLTALRTSVNDLQVAVLQANVDVKSQPVVRVSNNIEALFQGYMTVAASSNPTDLTDYLDALAGRGLTRPTQGTLTWADMGELSDQLSGTMTSSSLFMLLAQSEANKGTASIDNDALDRFMADKLLVQAQGFFLLSLANAKNPSVDLAQWTATHDARMETQRERFLSATVELNKLVLAAQAAPRRAQVGECEFGGFDIFGLPIGYEDATWAFRDQGAPEASTAFWGRQGCADNRVIYLDRVAAEVNAPWIAKQGEMQNIYNVLNLQGDYTSPSGGTVKVTVIDGYKVRWMNPNPGPAMLTNADGSLYVSLGYKPAVLSGDGDQPFDVKFGQDGRVTTIYSVIENVTYTRAASQP